MRVTLCTVLGLVVLIMVASWFAPQRTVVVEELVAEPGVRLERVRELVSDLDQWRSWSPVFAAGSHRLEVRPGATTAGLGGSLALVFDEEFEVLLMLASVEEGRVTVEARSGTVADDLEGGAGFRSWDEITFAAADDGRVHLVWTRTGADLDLRLLRLWDRFVIAPQARRQIRAGLEALAAAARPPV